MKPKLIVEQKVTAFTNKYTVYQAQEDGSKGQLLALAQQKRLAFKEKVTFYNDEAKSQEVFSFRAEKVMDIHGKFLVEDPSGKLIGQFKKEFAQSLFVSTWNILDEQDNPKILIRESNQLLAGLRRFAGFIPIIGDIIDLIVMLFKYHFVFLNPQNNEKLGKYEKTTLFRDHYKLSMTDESYSAEDWRVLAAMAVALDALQAR